MKKIFTYITFSIALMASSNAMAQSEFEALESHKEVQSISINKKMFEMITNVKMDLSNPTDKAYYDLIKKLDLLKVLSTKHSESKKELLNASNLIISNQSLQKFNETNSQNESSTLYLNSQDSNLSQISQLLLISKNKESNEVFIMYISGSFSLQELPSLTEKMDIPLPAGLTKK